MYQRSTKSVKWRILDRRLLASSLERSKRRSIFVLLTLQIVTIIAIAVTHQPVFSYVLSLLVIVAALTIPSMSVSLGLTLLLLAGRYELGALLSGYTDLALMLLLGCVISIMWRTSTIRWSHAASVLILLALAFIVVMLASLLPTWGNEYGREKVFRIVLYVPVYAIAPLILLTSRRYVKQLLVYIVAVGSAFGILSLILGVISHGLTGIQRLSPPGGGPITLARMVGFAAIASLGLWASGGRRHRQYGIASISLLMLTVVTGSRAPALFAGVMILVLVGMILPKRSMRDKALRYMALICGIVLLLLGFWKSTGISDTPFMQRFELLAQDDRGASIQAREDNIPVALKLGRIQPYTGLGAGSWATEIYGRDERQYPHNIFLELFVEQGLVGVYIVSLYIVMVIGIAIYRLRHTTNHETYALIVVGLGLFTYSILVAQTSGDLADNRYMWMFGTLIISITDNEETDCYYHGLGCRWVSRKAN